MHEWQTALQITIITAYYDLSSLLVVCCLHHYQHWFHCYIADLSVQACHSLEQVLAEDQYLSTRVQRVTIDSHQKAAYSVYRSACPQPSS